ncbi:3-dehydroquinate synthase [Synechocystis sp. PCC 7338]|uniref:3-dehydroquinate synthase n=1 Tax=Synechocystis sp. PCC 7338 TaxID=2732530 RepID=UPI001BB062FA|nr:3-dehydroquinate synthase [Synechocystis sp. PCC 7338]QUS59301.1 3-dehydroquinate synthase [Synechocystis sp. PCC 7338]
MATTIPVPLPQSPYQVQIAPGGLAEIASHLAPLGLGQKIMVVSNPEIYDHYGEVVIQALQRAGYEVFQHLIPAGETHKTLASINELYDVAFQANLERNSTLLALGGGVIGDMTGFGAATWLRGINFVQVPTSLLAMVDASIGGKTGVNHPQGKNLIGAFYQPRLVYIDPTVLKTLPEREFRAGMAEVIKYGVIWDPELFTALEEANDLSSIDHLAPALLTQIIQRSCQAKVDVVSQDEKEAGLRAILNYGHTIGHGVESLTGYGVINHGEAVAIGMEAAAKIAHYLELCDQDLGDRQRQLLLKTKLPTEIPPSLAVEDLLASLLHDKKVKAGKVRFILPTAIGQVIMSDAVTGEVIKATVL